MKIIKRPSLNLWMQNRVSRSLGSVRFRLALAVCGSVIGLGVSSAQAQDGVQAGTNTAAQAQIGQPATDKNTPISSSAGANSAGQSAGAQAKPSASSDQLQTAAIQTLPTPAPLAAPQLPLDPVAARAFAMLEKHCARCHQAGQLKKARPAGNFGNILRLDQIARDISLVRAGNPAGSRLYIQVLKREMPFDIFQEHAKGSGPSVMEVQSLHDWIAALGSQKDRTSSAGIISTAKAATETGAALQTPDCRAATNTSDTSGVGSLIKIERHLRGLPSSEAKDTRFITLTHLHHACASKRELAVYRQAVIKLLNSLSSAKAPLRHTTIDKGATIIAFRLSGLGWDNARWQKLIDRYPYGIALSQEQVVEFKRLTGSALPMVRGDWLAYAGTRAPLYGLLLRQPDTAAALQTSLKIDVGANIRSFLARRAVITGSGVAHNNRLLERHKTAAGSYWMTYDFSSSKGRANLQRYPVGPSGKRAFKHSLNASIYALPNGFSAYYLATEDGDRLEVAPDGILSDVRRRDGDVRTAISCMGCHSQGLIPLPEAPTDSQAQVFDISGKIKRFKRSLRDVVKGLYPPPRNIKAVLSGDVAAGREAMKLAGLDPDLTLNGDEPVTVLSKRYERTVSFRQAASELGTVPEQLVNKLSEISSQTSSSFKIGRRLRQGGVPRDLFAERFTSLISLVPGIAVDGRTSGAAANSAGFPVNGADAPLEASSRWGHDKNIGSTARSFDLAIFSDKSVYKRGDSARFWITSNTNCNLTLINVDVGGKGTVIFPNDFDPQNAIEAGDVLHLPGAGALYQFKMRAAGSEKIIGICNTDNKSADGIEHDFEKQKFTYLGDYAEFLADALKNEVTGRGQRKRVRVRVNRRAGRSRRRRYKTIYRATGEPELQARSALTIKVQ